MSVNPLDLWSLNQRSGSEVLHLSAADFEERVSAADIVLMKVNNARPCGFLTGFVEAKAFENFGYQWFLMRFESFLFVDRLIVDSKSRRSGVATELCNEALQWCREQRVEQMVCQVYDRPPNPAGHALLKTLHFGAIESVMLPSREIVTMYQRSTAIATP